MDNFQGDLTDIVRASAGTSGDPDWQFPSESMDNMDMDMFQQPIINPSLHGFGNPFSNMRDPLLHLPSSAASASSSCTFFIPTTPPPKQILTPPSAAGPLLQDNPTRFLGVGGSILGPKIFDDDHKKPPCTNRFSQMLQISTASGAGKLAVSPCGSPVVGGGASPKTGDMINANSSNSSGQISSPRNPGIKRRKSQAKKVVCIPAPASANSRPTGEVVPSDLWAWRKYGQKPIKGSPYPRGYYRCSSSKGCSARKQVERSRTDPNMLVITYTSEHNHPWPTQRNALAGSTRSQPSKNNSSASKNSQPLKMGTTKEEQKDQSDVASPNNIGSSSSVASVKEEMQLEGSDDKRFSDGFSYRPAMPDSTLLSEQDSFFADLDEIEADPLHLLFTQGFNGGDNDDGDNQGGERKDQTKAGVDEDQFSLFDWSEDNNKGL